MSFSDYISANSDMVTTELLGDENILKLITSAEVEVEDADDAEAIKDPVPGDGCPWAPEGTLELCS